MWIIFFEAFVKDIQNLKKLAGISIFFTFALLKLGLIQFDFSIEFISD